MTALMFAALTGQTECVELLLAAKADPHMKERMPYGKDPEDGRTALDIAKDNCWEDIVDILGKAEKAHPYGFYVPEGTNNNEKVYGGFEWGTKPEKGWYSARPGVAERNGFDPMKYGTGPYRQPADAFPMPPPPPSGAGISAAKKPAAQETISASPAAAPALDTIPVALLFPGQGSQYVGMLKEIKDIPAVKDMLAKARGILDYDLLEMCLNGPDTKLEETRFCQPAMFVAGLAGIEKLRVDREEAATRFQATAGLSLGEYTALCAAGVFTFEDGLKLVQLRGQAMQEAALMSKQAMLSVAGLDKPKLNDFCKEAAKEEGGKAVCQIANELFPKGYSCAGTEKAINILKSKAEAGGALQCRILKTSGGFHTSLMSPASDKLAKALDETLPKMSPPKHTIYMNTTAQPLKPGTDPKIIVELLKKQMVSPVLWEPSVRAMLKDGVKEYYEVGPMKQIKAMMKRIDPKAWNATTALEV